MLELFVLRPSPIADWFWKLSMLPDRAPAMMSVADECAVLLRNLRAPGANEPCLGGSANTRGAAGHLGRLAPPTEAGLTLGEGVPGARGSALGHSEARRAVGGHQPRRHGLGLGFWRMPVCVSVRNAMPA